MTDRTDAVQALHDAARGWRELGSHLDEIVQALDKEVTGVLTADWRGSGAEGFAAQWALLRSAVQEALPAFELAAGDLEQAAEAAEAVLGGGSDAGTGGDTGLGSDELAGGEVSSTSGTAGTTGTDASVTADASGGGDSTSALNAFVSEQLGAGLSHGSLDLGSDTPTGAASTPAPAYGGERDGEATGSALPTALRTESVLSSLGTLAATIASVFERTGGGGAGAGLGSPPLPSTPYDSGFLRRSEGMLGEALGAEPVDGGTGDSGKPRDNAPERPADDSSAAPDTEPDTEGSRIDSDAYPDSDPTPDSPERPDRPDPEGVDPDPTNGTTTAPGTAPGTTPRGAFG